MSVSGIPGSYDNQDIGIGGLKRAIAHFNQIMGTPRPLDVRLKRPFLQCERCQWRDEDLTITICPKCGSTYLTEISHMDWGDFPCCSG